MFQDLIFFAKTSARYGGTLHCKKFVLQCQKPDFFLSAYIKPLLTIDEDSQIDLSKMLLVSIESIVFCLFLRSGHNKGFFQEMQLLFLRG